MPPNTHPIGTILQDDDHRPVKVRSYYRQDSEWKVKLERLDRRFREQAMVYRWLAEIGHYPLIKKA